jgi:hypothetical protein
MINHDNELFDSAAHAEIEPTILSSVSAGWSRTKTMRQTLKKQDQIECTGKLISLVGRRCLGSSFAHEADTHNIATHQEREHCVLPEHNGHHH